MAANDLECFRAVADYTPDWESWHAPDARLVWVNPAVERITGYTVDDCLSMPDYPMPIVEPVDRNIVAEALASAREQKSGEFLDFRSLSRTGESRWMSLSWQPMYDSGRRHLGFRTSVRDITERQALREQLRLYAEHLEQLVQERTEKLRQLERRQQQMEKLAALGELAAGVAHEINNPLAGMRNAFELIRTSLTPDHEHFELLGQIDKEIERISGITHQMYQLYKRAPQQPSEFVIAQTVREVIDMLESTAAKHQVHLRFDMVDESIRVCLVEGEVKQILYNVVKNAIQVSSPGDEVIVTLQQDATEVLLHIKDQGPGIRPDIQHRIFDPFFSTKDGDAQMGMGLGLSVSRNLVEAMGGRIDVTSEPDRGSVFSIVFPQRTGSSQGVANG
ncbi:MAG: PAS domain S-box protein [Planctomycetota bacterium]|nr:MAG: PAS domain S-box protein [Planctomycetota bacterium]